MRLAEAWEEYHSVVSAFLGNSWLTKRTAAWVRQTEVTHSDVGWHVHSHWLLFFESDKRPGAEALLTEIPLRWVQLANAHGTEASLGAQQVTITRDVGKASNYATKGLLTRSKHVGKQTLEEILFEYQKGDADAAELWLEFAEFVNTKRRVWQASGGLFRADRGNAGTIEQCRNVRLETPLIPKSKQRRGERLTVVLKRLFRVQGLLMRAVRTHFTHPRMWLEWRTSATRSPVNARSRLVEPEEEGDLSRQKNERVT